MNTHDTRPPGVDPKRVAAPSLAPRGAPSLAPRIVPSLAPQRSSRWPAATAARLAPLSLALESVALHLRQGYEPEALDALAPLRDELVQLSGPTGLPVGPRRILTALLPQVDQLIAAEDSIGLADLLQHRLLPLIKE